MRLPDPIPVNPDLLPPPVQAGIRPDSPPERRLLLARAVIPLAPEALVSTLALLVDDRSEVVATAARTTLHELPWGVLAGGLSAVTDPGVLDHVARAAADREGVAALVAQNHATSDDTIVWLAARGRSDVLEIIAANQMRQQRRPEIIEALYYNPETRMGTISTVLENAVRSGLDLSHIPGYAEIVASILGTEAVQRVTPAAAAATAGGPAAGAPAQATGAEAPGQVLPPGVMPSGFEMPADFGQAVPDSVLGQDAADIARQIEQAMFDAGLSEAPPAGPEAAGVDDDSFMQILASAMTETDTDKEDDQRDNAPVWSRLGELSIPQRVRLALLGNDFVRNLLIRDPRRLVYTSVLKSPKLTIKDVVGYAKNRSLCDDVIRMIAGNRDWTKVYAVRLALTQNPKCPPVLAVNYLRGLTSKDLKQIAASRDVPGYVVRQARQILASRDPSNRKS